MKVIDYSLKHSHLFHTLNACWQNAVLLEVKCSVNLCILLDEQGECGIDFLNYASSALKVSKHFFLWN